MGAGYHGAFGKTYGSNRTYKIGYLKNGVKSYTKDELINILQGVTYTSTKIAKMIIDKTVGLNILGDRLFNYALGTNSETIAFFENGQIYIRASSSSIIDDLVHEGKHALDNLLLNKNINFINSKRGEFRAFMAEREFQISNGRKPMFNNLNEMLRYIKKHYN